MAFYVYNNLKLLDLIFLFSFLQLLGSGMSNKIWEATVEHAKECVLDDKHYMYCNGQGIMPLFNSIYELVGAMFDNSLYLLQDLTASQKVLTAQKLYM